MLASANVHRHNRAKVLFLLPPILEPAMLRRLSFVVCALLFVSPSLADDQPSKEGQKKKSPEAEVAKKKEVAEIKKPGKEGAAKEVAKEQPKEGGAKGQGRVQKVGVEGSTLKLVVDGKSYSFKIGDATRAMVKSRHEDGEEIVMALQLTNAGEGEKKPVEKKDGEKKDAKPEAKKDAKPDGKKPVKDAD